MSPVKYAVVPIQMREDLLKDPFFSSTWDEFDRESNRLSAKSKNGDFWDKVEKDMEKFEKGIADMERDMEDRMKPHRPSIPNWAIPEKQKHNWPSILPADNKHEIQGFRSQSIKDTETNWMLELDLGGFEADGVKLSVKGDIVIVRAGKSNLVLDQKNQTSFSQSIERRFTLPVGCDPDHITSRIDNNKMLIVNCPRKLMLSGPSSKAIRSYTRY